MLRNNVSEKIKSNISELIDYYLNDDDKGCAFFLIRERYFDNVVSILTDSTSKINDDKFKEWINICYEKARSQYINDCIKGILCCYELNSINEFNNLLSDNKLLDEDFFVELCKRGYDEAAKWFLTINPNNDAHAYIHRKRYDRSFKVASARGNLTVSDHILTVVMVIIMSQSGY
jgi:hypothetical protein